MVTANLEATRRRAYKIDIPLRVAAGVATVLGPIVELITLGAVKRKPSPFTVWLALFLTVDVVAFAAAAAQGNLWPNADQQQQLLEDAVGLTLLLLSPVAVAIAFRFYEQVYPTFDHLRRYQVLSLESRQLDEVESRIDACCNSIRWAVACFGFAVLFYAGWLLLPPLTGVRGGASLLYSANYSWGLALPVGIKLYLGFWSLMGWFVLFSFVYKAVVISKAIQRLSLEEEVPATEARFSVNLDHPDGSAGFDGLARLWLNVNYIVVIVGVALFVWVARWQDWHDPLTWAEISAYALFAPLLFLGPFVRLHTAMQGKKRKELERCVVAWQKAKSECKGAEARLWRKRYNEARNLPTWPLSLATRLRFTGSYLLPLGLSVVQSIFPHVRILWPWT